MHLRPRTALTLCIPLRGNSHFASSPVPPSRCIISAARTVRWHSPYPSRMTVQYGDQTVCEQVCCVSRPLATGASSPPLPSPPVSSHRQRAAIPRIAHATSQVTCAHALRMQPLSTPLTSKLRGYRRTTQPSSGPSGCRKSCFLWMLFFSSQPSLWRNVLRLAHCFRASDGTFLDCCDALLFCRRLCRAHKSPALHVAATAPTSLATRSRTLSQ